MIIGEKKLQEIFPNFKEDIKGNGIDLRIGEVYIINRKKTKECGCVNDNKRPPEYAVIKKDHKDKYTFRPKNFYMIKADRPIHIPHGYTQNYYLRSTFARCGIILTDAVGDDGFQGTLMFGIYNSGPVDVHAGFNERIVQAITTKNDGTTTEYDGSYQHDRIYEEKGNLRK